MRYFYYVVNEGSFTMAKIGKFKDKSEWLKLKDKFDEQTGKHEE